MSAENDVRPARYQLFDMARGVAIALMVVFHIAWDLYYFGYTTTDVTTELGWVIFQKSIVASFLLLVGASLVLGHGQAIRWRRFWRRFAILVVAALLVTAGTYWMFPDYFVFFGVLHAIALFSLLALPFLKLPGPIVLAAGLAVVALSFAISDPVFSSRELGWIGFWSVSPPTSDVVPIFPWFGVVLIGMGLMRLLVASRFNDPVRSYASREPLLRGLAFAGRWSLPIYLVHQPLLIAGFYGLLQLQSPVLAPPVPSRADGFLQSCVASCRGTGAAAGHCDRYCACALDEVEKADLWAAVASGARSPDEDRQVGEVTRLCTALAD